MAFANVSKILKQQQPSMLEQLLEEINFQRTKEMRQLLKDGVHPEDAAPIDLDRPLHYRRERVKAKVPVHPGFEELKIVEDWKERGRKRVPISRSHEDKHSGFVMLQGTTYWTDLFVRHFLFQTEHSIDCDDLLFFVRKRHVKGSSRYLPKFETEVDVFRKDSRKLPVGDPDVDWEETVYLNLVVHQLEYTLTLATCTRTSPKELQVLRRHSQKVYASPSRRRMDAKGELEEMTYPNVCFMVDNFDEVFSDILVRDGEMVCVELVAADRDGTIQGVIFLGSIRYDALKKVYDARSSLSSKMAQRMTFGLFSSAATQRVEFVRMKGPQGKGHAEMAVTKPKGSGAETPTSEPGYCALDMWDSDWDEDPEDFFVYRHQRRLSDPSANLNNFVRGGWKTKSTCTGSATVGATGGTVGPKSRSENEGLDSMANGLNEIQAGDVRDALDVCFRPPPTTTPDALNNNNNHHHHQQPSPNNEMSNDRGVTVSAGNTPLRQPRRMSSVSPPYRLTPDGTLVNYWCDMSPVTRRDSGKELDDGAYNPLWTMRGFTQTFHFWKETRRAQSTPLNAFLTYITLPWWSIAKDILDHREGPILTF